MKRACLSYEAAGRLLDRMEIPDPEIIRVAYSFIRDGDRQELGLPPLEFAYLTRGQQRRQIERRGLQEIPYHPLSPEQGKTLNAKYRRSYVKCLQKRRKQKGSRRVPLCAPLPIIDVPPVGGYHYPSRQDVKRANARWQKCLQQAKPRRSPHGGLPPPPPLPSKSCLH
jgi:hypothetical protein